MTTKAQQALDDLWDALNGFYSEARAEPMDIDIEARDTIRNSLMGMEWQPISTLPKIGHIFIWWEYDDRSGTGHWAEAFSYDGVIEIVGFKEWDRQHKIPTHWKPKSIVTDAPKPESQKS